MEENTYIDWSDIFFTLHKYCGLTKWEIWEYTLPQITELLRCCNRYIEFEVKRQFTVVEGLQKLLAAAFGLPIRDGNGQVSESDATYQTAKEDDINTLARFLGG